MTDDPKTLTLDEQNTADMDTFVVHADGPLEQETSPNPSEEKPDEKPAASDDDGGEVGAAAEDDGDDDDGDDASEGLGLEDFLKSDDDDTGEGADDDKGAEAEKDAGEEEDVEPKKQKRSVSKRIGRLTADMRSAESRATKAEEKAAALEVQLAEATKKLTGDDDGGTGGSDEDHNRPVEEPKPDDFTYGELDPEYTKALAKFSVNAEMARGRETEKTSRKAATDQHEAEEFAEALSGRIQVGIDEFDDFQEVVIDRSTGDNPEFPLSDTIGRLAVSSAVGHKVIYDIASNQKLALEIDAMSVTEQARAFGRLEERHTSKPKAASKRTTKAPKPLKGKARGTSGGSGFDPKTASLAEIEKRFYAGELE